MDKLNISHIEILPKYDNPIFEQRESGVAHTPYQTEVRFYSQIENGNVEGVKRAMRDYFSQGIVVGRLSNDNLKQMQYLAVSSITLATRYAIRGGLNESVAYNLSDSYILQIDSFTSGERIMDFLGEKALELTSLVREAKERSALPAAVKKCMRYIDKNLHSKITLRELSELCGLCQDYLSFLFKKSTGVNVSRYIMLQKLEASKELLINRKYDYREIGYYFSFCSETYYISCFKREFGMTPKQYAENYKI